MMICEIRVPSENNDFKCKRIIYIIDPKQNDCNSSCLNIRSIYGEYLTTFEAKYLIDGLYSERLSYLLNDYIKKLSIKNLNIIEDFKNYIRFGNVKFGQLMLFRKYLPKQVKITRGKINVTYALFDKERHIGIKYRIYNSKKCHFGDDQEFVITSDIEKFQSIMREIIYDKIINIILDMNKNAETSEEFNNRLIKEQNG